MQRLALLFFSLAHCTVDRSGFGVADTSPPDVGFDAPFDSSLDGGVDAPEDAPVDVGPDVSERPDAGPPHCRNGILDGVDGETDVDCGGVCAPCLGCRGCMLGSDCASGECEGGQCRVVLSTVSTVSGSTIPAYVDEAGHVLLARYPAGFDSTDWAYDSLIPQRLGGAVPPPGWAPDPCFEPGHLAWGLVAAESKQLELVCGRGDDAPSRFRANIPRLDAFGVIGSIGAPSVGDQPGWIVLARDGVGARRTGLCGTEEHTSGGGIAFCAEQGSRWYDAHQASVFVHDTGHSLGCNGSGCTNRSCDIWLEIWLR